MHPISLARFNALAGYCRDPRTLWAAEELKWFEHDGERVLATLIRDRTDDDFVGIILGRDRKGRFRYAGHVDSHTSQHRVEVLLEREMERLSMAPDEQFHQGDETGRPSDFFTPIVSRDRLSKAFVALAEEERFSPARGIIGQMMHWHEDLDGKFVKQFQTTGFDARLWELYLFATFAEMEYRIEHIHAVPDLTCVGVLGELTVEAMTVNPSRDQDGSVRPPPPRESPEQQRAFLHEYMPIRFAKTLTSKLAKKYWEKPSAKDKPLLFAIQDFSAEASMVSARSALEVYLYGYDHEWKHDSNGRLTITARRVDEHRWGKKAVLSGFFDSPGAEHVSAVLSNNSGTISKFNRMGVLAGFGSPRVVLVREGFAMDHDPDAAVPQAFRYIVNTSGHQETWTEGLNVFHNPRAIQPLDPAMLPEAAHHRRLRDGRVESLIPPFHPLGSFTFSFLPEDEAAATLQGDKAESSAPVYSRP